jgi:hypothetical protein
VGQREEGDEEAEDEEEEDGAADAGEGDDTATLVLVISLLLSKRKPFSKFNSRCRLSSALALLSALRKNGLGVQNVSVK